jgi:hypothetical protein
MLTLSFFSLLPARPRHDVYNTDIHDRGWQARDSDYDINGGRADAGSSGLYIFYNKYYTM